MPREMEGTYEKVSYEDNNSVLLYVNRQSENYDTHWHAAAEIIMPIENEYHAIINNRNHTYELAPNDILFIPPGELHTLIAPTNGRRLILMFDFSVFNNMEDFSSMLPILSQPVLLSPDSDPEIHAEEVSLLNRIMEEYAKRSEPMRVSMIFSYLLQFFVHIGRLHIRAEVRFPDVRVGKQQEYVEKLNNVITYINTNYAEEITLEKAAALAGFSKFHFSRLFRQFTGQSYYNYLNARRVKAAEALLLNPHLSVTDVAMQSGFTSIATFNRVFRQAKDCTPSEYKNYYHRRSRIR
ncbi:MAG: helix-turn-helix transcriptional regulator [Lachnospiraceae bacterium]|nr:helix-turn-helix transcriptional regulator [Lachnospiraceae bacterium]